jgi:hypothetical protein
MQEVLEDDDVSPGSSAPARKKRIPVSRVTYRFGS